MSFPHYIDELQSQKKITALAEAGPESLARASSGGVLLLFAVAAVARPWHGFETRPRDRLLAHLAHAVGTTSHSHERFNALQ